MKRYLAHRPDSEQHLDGTEDVSRATTPGEASSRLELGSPDGATSVRRGIRTGTAVEIPDGWIDERLRRERLEAVSLRWEQRATRLNQAIASRKMGIPDELPEDTETLLRQRAYAVSRVQRLRADIAPRLELCGTEFLPIACGCGLVGATQACRQFWLCERCRRKRMVPLSADIRRGLRAALDREVEAWGREGGRGMRPEIRLITLTARHSGNLSADQQSIARGWRALYKRMHEDDGAFPYVGVWEVTPGRDGKGHVHMHIAVIWRFRDYQRVREQWTRACPTSMQFDIKRKRRDGKGSTPSSVAGYIGKYISKGADVDAFTPALRAEVSAAFYNQRAVIASLGFWIRVPKCCAKCQLRYRLVEIEAVPLMDRFRGPLEMYLPKARPPPEMLEALR